MDQTIVSNPRKNGSLKLYIPFKLFGKLKLKMVSEGV